MAADHETDNIRLLRRLYEVWDAQDGEAVIAMLDPEFEWVNPVYAVDPGIRRGHDGFRKVMENLDTSFCEQHRVIEGLVDLGDRVLAHTIFQAEGRDSGAKIDIPEQHLWTMRDGKVLRIEWFHDAAEAERAAHDAR
jgi:ketosteroid isomerase-like protein